MSLPVEPDYFKKNFPNGIGANFARFVADRLLPPVLRFFLKFRPGYRIPFSNCHLLLGFDVVQEAFARSAELTVTNDSKTTALGWDPPFLLAVRLDDDAYKRVHSAVRQYWSGTRIEQIRTIARDAFAARLAKLGPGTHRINAIHDLMVPAFLEIIEKNDGVRIPDDDRDAFLCDLFVLSGFFFSKAKQEKEKKDSRRAQQAFDHAQCVLAKVIAEARSLPAEGRTGALGASINAGVKDQELQSWLLGMILGFIPTSTNAQGRILDVLLRNSAAIGCAQLAALSFHERKRDADDEYRRVTDRNLLAVCHEALRLNYILPGLFRVSVSTTDLTLGEGTKSPIIIKAGSTVFLSNQTAMFDKQRFDEPTTFKPDRAYLKYLNYGHRMHYCVAWDISDVVMEETFGALVRAQFGTFFGAKREWRGAYPWNFEIEVTVP